MPQGHIARKRFGQNFLVDAGIINEIVAAIQAAKGDKIVEIGPGLGALTKPLIHACGHIQVVEIDRDLIARIRKLHSDDQITVHEGDALKFDFASLGDDLRIVGNLPYNISTPLLFHLADFADNVKDMTFMLQKEVVERMVAQPSTPNYGRLSVMLQYRFEMAHLFDVPPHAFNPAPKVVSSIVYMRPKKAANLRCVNEKLLAEVVAQAFSQRRKTIRNTLIKYADEATLVSLGMNSNWRAENLGLDDFVRLVNHLAQQNLNHLT